MALIGDGSSPSSSLIHMRRRRRQLPCPATSKPLHLPSSFPLSLWYSSTSGSRPPLKSWIFWNMNIFWISEYFSNMWTFYENCEHFLNSWICSDFLYIFGESWTIFEYTNFFWIHKQSTISWTFFENQKNSESTNIFSKSIQWLNPRTFFCILRQWSKKILNPRIFLDFFILDHL